MDIKIIVVFGSLALLSFLYSLNLFLRGNKKTIIEFALGFLIMANVIVSFFVLKWWVGLIATFSAFLFIAIFISLAKPLAYKILGFRTGIDDETTENSTSIFKALTKADDLNKVFDKLEKISEKNRNKLLRISNKPTIAFILYKNNISFDEYYRMFESLLTSGLADIAWEIVSEPKDLEDLICLIRDGVDQVTLSSHFRNFN